ncbi:12383_t:CDS:1, partial [Acaulospora colombiana]
MPKHQSETYTFFCVLDNDERKNPFIVKVETSAMVAQLTSGIVEECKLSVPAYQLQLYQVDIQEISPKKRKVLVEERILGLKDEEALDPPALLSDIYPSGITKSSVHFIVRVPPSESIADVIRFVLGLTTTPSH